MTLKNIFITAAIILLLVFVAMFFLFFLQEDNTPIKTDNSPIAIGIMASDENVVAKYQAFTDYLNKYSGKKWRLEPVISHGSFIEQIENHRIKSAFVGSAVGYRMIKNSLGVPIVRGEKNGISTYEGNIVVKKNSEIYSIEDLKNKRFAYIDVNMSSGYFFPFHLLYTKGYDADDFFRASSFLGTSEKVIEAVLSGNFDAGTVKNLDLSDMIEKDPDIQNKIRVIETEGPFPENTFMLSIDFNEKEINEIQSLLLNMNNSEEGRDLLSIMGIDRFIKTNSEDFSKVEQIMSF